MKFKKVLSGTVTAAMMGVLMCGTAFAEAPALENGSYTGTIHFYNGSKPDSVSMCDPIFVHEAEVELTDDAAELTFYVAYPVPNYSTMGTDGTIKDVVMTIGENEYTGESDITTKPVKTFDTAGPVFGINAGDELSTQVITVELPRDAVDEFEAGIETSAFVNVVMNATQEFYVKVTELQSNSSEDTKTETQDMQVTANVAEEISAPSYNVTVPASVTLGTLKTDADNELGYKVNVKASDLNGGTLTVKAPETGSLTSGEATLAFTNSFAEQTVTGDTDGTELTGTIGVTAAAVDAAAAGNYTGTTTFSFFYTAK